MTLMSMKEQHQLHEKERYGENPNFSFHIFDNCRQTILKDNQVL